MQTQERFGWQCGVLRHQDLTVHLTLDVGPRVIALEKGSSGNLLMAYEKYQGLKGGRDFRSYGGHRFWLAPELREITYEPDNDPVIIEPWGNGIALTKPLGHTHLERTMRVCLAGEVEPHVMLEHTVTNRGTESVTIAPWTITVMEPGGECLVPQESFAPHPDNLLPARPIVLWPYADMSDPRYEWGKSLIRLRQAEEAPPTKFGTLVKQGYAAYWNRDHLFLKRFPYDATATYPDYHVNFESFTRPGMLEVEALGALVTLQSGESVTQPETWYVISCGPPPADNGAAAEWLAEKANSRPLRQGEP